MNEQRPSPEEFLGLIRQTHRGRLKIYIGHAAGTGKTMQMLREGNDLYERGAKVAGAYIETHGRTNTEAAIQHLPIIPRRQIEYKGSLLEELDLDAVLASDFKIVIVDELAHTNVPGSRNPKRWQDVNEILDHGISVITAVNIQHIESLNAVVSRVTGIQVMETVPDSFIASADQIINLDISAADLRERIRRGEVYAPDKIERALNNFFTSINLNSLRELALREVASSLDRERRSQRQVTDTDASPEAIQANPSPLAESYIDPIVMVAISSRPPDVRSLLRKAAAIADRLGTHWYLTYVELPSEGETRIDATTQRILQNNISLAKDLGATVVRLKGKDVAHTLASFAKEYGVTHAIFGSPGKPRGLRWWVRLFKPDLITEFREMAPNVDIHISGHPSAMAENRHRHSA